MHFEIHSPGNDLKKQKSIFPSISHSVSTPEACSLRTGGEDTTMCFIDTVNQMSLPL